MTKEPQDEESTVKKGGQGDGFTQRRDPGRKSKEERKRFQPFQPKACYGRGFR